MSEVVVQEESTHEAMAEMVGLISKHYGEVEEKSGSVPFAINLPVYFQLLDWGMMYIVTARVDGELVGYFANLLEEDPVTSKSLSRELGIYVKPEFRGSPAFKSMAAEVERLAQEKGAYSQLLSFKKGHDVGIAQKLGYELTETIYQKVF